MKGFIHLGALLLGLSFSLTTFAGEARLMAVEPTAAEIQACIAEAQADYEYYVARVEGAEALLYRAKGNETYRKRLLERAERLHGTRAVAQEHLDHVQADHGDAINNIMITQALVSERKAEMRAAEARLAQAKIGRCLRLPSH